MVQVVGAPWGREGTVQGVVRKNWKLGKMGADFIFNIHVVT